MVMRIGGLASGMDIDSLVEKLMKAERMSLDKTFQKKQTLEWKRDAYRNVNTKLKTFDDFLFNKMILSGKMNQKVATSSNENLVAVKATSGASGNITIDSVSQLASAAQVVSSNPPTPYTGETKLSALGISESSLAIQSIGKDGKLAEATPITLTADMTVNDLVKKINDSGAGVTALVEKGQLSLTAKNTGKELDGKGEIVVKDGLSVFNKLGINSIDGKLATNGKNAEFVVNGIAAERSSNVFTISGYEMTLKQTFNSTNDSTTVNPVTIQSSSDTKAAKEQVIEFVEKYNEMIEGFNKLLKENKYRDYAPLTDEQRKDMNENEQKLWDEKAKSGLLRSDSIIRDGMSKMRSTFMGNVAGLGDKLMDSLAEIGITTSKDLTDNGKLVIDDKKLDAALAKDPDQVFNMFSKSGSITGTEDSRGIAVRLRDEMKKMTAQIEKQAGKDGAVSNTFSLGIQINESDERMKKMQDKLKDIEARYWKQFTAMEQAINKANQQSSMFMQG